MFKGKPIEEAYKRLPRGQIAHADVLEWMLACRWWRLDWADWSQLDADEQARRIAVYRVERMIEAVTSWDRARKQEEAVRRGRKR